MEAARPGGSLEAGKVGAHAVLVTALSPTDPAWLHH